MRHSEISFGRSHVLRSMERARTWLAAAATVPALFLGGCVGTGTAYPTAAAYPPPPALGSASTGYAAPAYTAPAYPYAAPAYAAPAYAAPAYYGYAPPPPPPPPRSRSGGCGNPFAGVAAEEMGSNFFNLMSGATGGGC